MLNRSKLAVSTEDFLKINQIGLRGKLFCGTMAKLSKER
jgi:hypothetical protein